MLLISCSLKCKLQLCVWINFDIGPWYLISLILVSYIWHHFYFKKNLVLSTPSNDMKPKNAN